MNPYSIDANGVNTAPDTLAFRATLGGELYTSSISVHPKVTGSWVTTQSFTGTSTFKFNQDLTVFVPNTESFFLNQFPAGIKNRVSNKIRQQGEILPYSGSNETNLPTNQVLSPFISIQQSVTVSGSYTPNIDYVEVAFSPQNQINNDIAGQLGYFNIGEYIGDPRLVSSSAESYPALDGLRNYYFEKYTGNYNIWDYIRLIKYFDNSLFKMIADWTPARTDLASGIVIKQTTLERNKYPVPQLDITSSLAMVESGSYETDVLYNLTNEEVADVNFIVLPTQSYNLGTTFSGSFNNVSGDNGSNCYIWYYTPDALFGPPIVLFYQSLYTTEEVPFNFTYGSIVSGSKIEFYCDSTAESVLLNAYVTGSWLEASNVPYEVEDLLITGSSIQMYTITGSSGGSIVDTEILTFSTASYILNSGDIITFNLSSSGAERISCYISSSAENSNPAIITLYNQSTSSYTTSSVKLNYTLNQTFDISTGYLRIQNNSLDATIKISNLEVYQAPSYYQTVETVYGLNQILVPNEFDFNGELEGSEILVTDGDLNPSNPYKHPSTQVILFDVATVLDVYSFPVVANNITLYGYTEDPSLSLLFYLTIPNQSKNGVDITSALDNLTTGNRIKFTTLSSVVSFTYNFDFQIKTIKNIVGGVFIEIASVYGYNPSTEGDPIATNSEANFTPFLNEPNFYASAFNPITNNADIPRLDPEFFDVDFSTNAITAVNRVNIISASRGQGVATPAPVQASNYTTARIINPRYVGSKNTSPDFNIIDNQQLPSVEKYTSYFIYTPGGSGNTLAERSGSGNYKIGFLVDELGNVIQPTANNTGSAYVPNLLDAFGADTTVILSPNNTQTIDQTEYTVYKPGVVSNIIMYSDTGSLGNDYLVSGSYNSINFQVDPNIKFNYGFFASKNTDQIISTTTPIPNSETASFNNIVVDSAQGWTSSINAYKPQYNSLLRNRIGGRLEINVPGTGSVTMSIMNGTSSLTSSAGSGPNTDLLLEATSSQYFNTSDLYWLKVINNSNASITVKKLW
jgi:hypothetical protein